MSTAAEENHHHHHAGAAVNYHNNQHQHQQQQQQYQQGPGYQQHQGAAANEQQPQQQQQQGASASSTSGGGGGAQQHHQHSHSGAMLTRRPSRDRSGGAAGKRGESTRVADWAWENSHWTKLRANKERDRDVPKCRLVRFRAWCGVCLGGEGVGWLGGMDRLTDEHGTQSHPHRSGHACVQIGHYMYIIGGYSDGACAWRLALDCTHSRPLPTLPAHTIPS